MYEQLRELTEEAKRVGTGRRRLVLSRAARSSRRRARRRSTSWPTRRRSRRSRRAHHQGQAALGRTSSRTPRARSTTEKIPIETLADRVRHVVQSAFDGRRIVIFSGGGKAPTTRCSSEIRAIRDGGGFGSIIGRNSFQRPLPDAVDAPADDHGHLRGQDRIAAQRALRSAPRATKRLREGA